MSMLVPLLLGLQALDAPVTYTTVAKPVGLVLQEISALMKVSLKSSKEVSGEIVLVSVTGEPLQNVLNKLADATSCRWDIQSDGYTLAPDQAKRTQEAAKEALDKENAVKASFQKNLDRLAAKENAAKNPPKTDGQDQGEEAVLPAGGPFGMGGDDRPVLELLSMTDPSVISAMSGDDRAVWATNSPTASQRSLNGDGSSIVMDWVKQHNAESAGAPAMDALSAQMPKEFADMMKARITPVNTPIAKALVIVSSMPMMGIRMASVEVFDTGGKIVMQGQAMIDSSDMMPLMAQAQDPSKTKPKATPDPQSPSIEYSEDSKKIQAAMSSPNAALSVKLPPELREKLIHPEKWDPLAFAVSDRYLSYAKQTGHEIVADIPDAALMRGVLGVTTGNAKTVEDVKEELNPTDKSAQEVSATEDGKFLIIRPAKPDESRRVRIDRSALGTFLASSEEGGTASLDALSNYALATVSPSENSLSNFYLSLFSPGLMVGMALNGGSLNWNLLRFYGSLDESRRIALKGGASIAFSYLDTDQQRLAANLLYGANISVEAEGAKQQDIFSRMIAQFGFGGSAGQKEITEAMPAGLPNGGSLSMGVTSDPVIFLGNPSEGGAFYLGPEEVALFTGIKGMTPGQTLPFPSSGFMGSRTNIDLHFHIASGLAVNFRLTDPYLDKNAEKGSLDHLPADFQSKVDSETAKLKNSPFGSIASMMAGKLVTPP